MVHTGDAHLQPATAVMGYAMQAEDEVLISTSK
jgi:hypothetical protein